MTTRRSLFPSLALASSSYRSVSTPTGADKFQPILLDSPPAERDFHGCQRFLQLLDPGRNLDLHRMVGRVTQSEFRTVLVSLPDERSNAGEEDEVLSGSNGQDPVPNRSSSEVATATIRKLVNESLKGISTEASPLASSGTRPFHRSNVSNSSRVICFPPPPPVG